MSNASLKDPKTQKDFRSFIEEKLRRYWLEYPPASHLINKANDPQRNAQSNIMILLRKLREGLVASRRVDRFGLDVYEVSLYLSVLFRTPAQTTSIVTRLLSHDPDSISEGLYNEHMESVLTLRRRIQLESEVLTDAPPRQHERQLYRPPHARRENPSQLIPVSHTNLTSSLENFIPNLNAKIMSTRLFSLLHVLVYSFPFQSSYHSQLKSIHAEPSPLGKEGSQMAESFRWLKAIATSLASRNYVRFERLTQTQEVDRIYQCLGPLDPSDMDFPEERRFALKCLVEDLRGRLRDSAWEILTTAYREVNVKESSDWLLRCLMISLDPQTPQTDSFQSAEAWLDERGEAETKRKEGRTGHWVLYRRRI
ncbi:hypothetical protein K439DRAFT_123952 [Ramaria rubella]|nr:hypothetical protein K439DRAFT_123952 [Ramaria rubella]